MQMCAVVREQYSIIEILRLTFLTDKHNVKLLSHWIYGAVDVVIALTAGWSGGCMNTLQQKAMDCWFIPRVCGLAHLINTNPLIRHRSHPVKHLSLSAHERTRSDSQDTGLTVFWEQLLRMQYSCYVTKNTEHMAKNKIMLFSETLIQDFFSFFLHLTSQHKNCMIQVTFSLLTM